MVSFGIIIKRSALAAPAVSWSDKSELIKTFAEAKASLA